jgi:hypothetical protein
MTPHLFRTYREPIWARFVPLIVRCSENACDFKNETLPRSYVELPRIAGAGLWTIMLQCGRRATAAKIWLGSIAGTYFAPARFTGLTLRLRGAAALNIAITEQK